MTRLKESDMFQPVKSLLSEKMHCEVYAEVADYDVVGIGKTYGIIVEMKKSLTWKLIEQAHRAIGLADYIFVAIPKPKSYGNRIAASYLKQDGIGIIYVDGQRAYVHSWGKRHRTKKRWKPLKDYVLPHHKLTTGGVKSGDGPTEYSITIDNIKFCLRRHHLNDGWMTVDEILETIQTHYANPKPSIMATLQAHWNQDWCETKVEKGKRYFRYKLAVAR
ncbi:hypothetical protein [Sporosarcina sp. FSL K6-3457]|uniref:hypothetical protein n=1 Tax=Sporosarcina sp. FSL K6-3457 TaxID=2978204 RepID=UPI0030F95622